MALVIQNDGTYLPRITRETCTFTSIPSLIQKKMRSAPPMNVEGNDEIRKKWRQQDGVRPRDACIKNAIIILSIV